MHDDPSNSRNNGALAAMPWHLSSILLAAAGMVVAVIGAYFILLRPPLLAEDIRYIQLTAAEYATVGPQLGLWLSSVFRVLGGFAMGTGVLAVALAATGYRTWQPFAMGGAVVGGVLSIGLMTLVNFEIDSDFKWFLASAAAIWALSLIAFLAKSRPPKAAGSNPGGPEADNHPSSGQQGITK